MTPADLKIINENNGIRMVVQGDFTTVTLANLKQELSASLSRDGGETLDLSKCTVMDVVGIQLAYAWKKALDQNHRTATVVLPESETVRDLFMRTGITQIL